MLDTVIHSLADFVSEDVSNPLEVSAETHSVFLDLLVAHLRDETVEYRIGLA